MTRTSRREFMAGIAGAGAALGLGPLTARSNAMVAGANDRLNVAVVGIRSRGKEIAKSFAKSGARLAALVDVDRDILRDTSNSLREEGVRADRELTDIRRVLDASDIDAVAIAAPDHWHAPGTIMALDAGKHVYVEKPCGHNPREGELLVEAQAKSGLVVQMGNQQRSAALSIELIEAIRAGELGEIYHAYSWYANNRDSIGNGKPAPVPASLDWELWQGPAPRTPYRDNVHPYNWHWFWHWGTGESANNAAHELDVARWAMDVGHPEAVDVEASRQFYTDDDWEMYDTMQVRYRYPEKRTIVWEGHSCNKVLRFGRSRGAMLYGTKGSALVDREGYAILDLAGETVRERTAAGGGADSGDLVGGGDMTDDHVANFIDTVRGTAAKQNSPIDEGATSTLMCHLANIAYRTGRDLEIDPGTGRPRDAAAMKYWSREYEPGWEPKV